ncbi:hypothetical protein [Glaciecola sp. KUL10]|uniref:hypothetical protein n=1 Tax=Glaciecola sp. (strain KUL10) TaxID=2161813 RepID=UPI000D781D36|nr:hypothetical protein [Glaciecola sp. KUL10]GBL03319.1 hypothetical protein KUL10_06020 [Glaciecola sp. KUL10]
MELNDYVSFIVILIAIASVLITNTVYRSNSDPDVIVYADLDLKRAGLLILIIKNIGKGPAVDIRISTSRPLPQEAFNSDISDEEMSSG